MGVGFYIPHPCSGVDALVNELDGYADIYVLHIGEESRCGVFADLYAYDARCVCAAPVVYDYGVAATCVSH